MYRVPFKYSGVANRGGSSYRSPYRSSGLGLGCAAIVAVILLFLVGSCSYVAALKSSAKTVTITVDSKESVNIKDGHEYRVYTDNGVYVVSDSLVFWNWRAADRYAALKTGHTYECTSAGWRIGLFSSFPNLIDCTEVQA